MYELQWSATNLLALGILDHLIWKGRWAPPPKLRRANKAAKLSISSQRYLELKT